MTDEYTEDPLAPMFSLYDFKKWMTKNGQGAFGMSGKSKSEGLEVEPRMNIKKIMDQMEPEIGNTIEMARQFRDNGGRVVEANGDCFLVEVSCGIFRLPRNCVRLKS